MKNKIYENIKKYKILYIVLLMTIILNLLVLFKLGSEYTLHSDDESYVISGIEFLKNGRISIHGYEKTAQVMPGMAMLISFFVAIFGSGKALWLSLKIFWIIMATLSVYGLFKTIRLFANDIISGLITCFLLAADFLWMNNLILTETPFMLAFIFLVYHTFLLEQKRDWKNYWWIVFWYLFGIMIRPNIGIYPLFLFVYLLMKKYDFKLLIKQGVIATLILLSVLTPWTIRNYQVFHRFIPLTYGTGNPLLMGTYQGYNYPLDEELDYEKEVNEKLPIEMQEYLFGKYKGQNKPLNQYYSLEYDKLKAEYRMKEWWKKDSRGMLRTYFIYKPKVMVRGSFYWISEPKIPVEWNVLLRDIDLVLTVISIIAIFIFKKYRAELFLLLINYIFQVALYCYTYALNRYGQALYFLRFIIIGIGMSLIYKSFVNRRKKDAVIA